MAEKPDTRKPAPRHGLSTPRGAIGSSRRRGPARRDVIFVEHVSRSGRRH